MRRDTNTITVAKNSTISTAGIDADTPVAGASVPSDGPVVSVDCDVSEVLVCVGVVEEMLVCVDVVEEVDS